MNLDEEQKFSPSAIIAKKRDGHALTREEVLWFSDGVHKDFVDQRQAAAFLMACYLKGMNVDEIASLTDAMLASGRAFSFDDPTVIDKHSSGGVGDKTSFILAPIAAACGVKVPMISGRGLGHTGGTIDKIESIPGIVTEMGYDDFISQLNKYGQVLIGQSSDIAPVDKIFYSLRDITATVDSIPLITASIMSKKLAEGAAGYVLDVKVGNGAFMNSLEEAEELAESLARTGLRFGKKMTTLITDMNQPLGNNIGNALEMIEVIETLSMQGPKDLTNLSLELAGSMIYLAGICPTEAGAKDLARTKLENGEALAKFRELIQIQGGDASYIDDPKKFHLAEMQTQILSERDGYINTIQTEKLGGLIVTLGGGRRLPGENIDHSVGIRVEKKLGDKVAKGDTLVTIYHHQNQEQIVKNMNTEIVNEIYEIEDEAKELSPLIISKKNWTEDQ